MTTSAEDIEIPTKIEEATSSTAVDADADAEGDGDGEGDTNTEENSEALAYIQRNEFTSEIFKVEIRNLGIFGIGEFKKFLKRNFSLDVSKIKSPKRKEYAYVCFRSMADMDKAIRDVDGFVWKGKALRVRKANATPDPLVMKRQNENTPCTSTEPQNLKRRKTSAEATCPLSHLPYEDQLKNKYSEMVELLQKFGRGVIRINSDLTHIVRPNGLPCDFEGVRPAPKIDGYRNKSEFSIGKNSDGETVVGFRLGSYADGSVEIGSLDTLPHIPESAKKAAKTFEEFIATSKFECFNPVNNSGHFRQLTVRTSAATDEIMLIVGIYSSNLKDDEIKVLQEELKAFYANYEPVNFNCTSLYYQDLKRRDAGQVVSPVEHLSGTTHITDVIHGLKFRISPLAFFQVNTQAAEVLYQQAIDLVGPKPNTTVMDICCGTGTISICFANHCKQVMGVDIVPEAIKDAEVNAKENGIENTTFFAGNADDYIQSMVKQVMYSAVDRDAVDLVAVVDPPRAGLRNKSIAHIRNSFSIKRLVYISCNPKSALRNWVDLCRPESKTYRGSPFIPKTAVAVDMFPHTAHTEMVILFERLKNHQKTDLAKCGSTSRLATPSKIIDLNVNNVKKYDSRNFIISVMGKQYIEWHFQVAIDELQDFESVGITGNIDQLGNWQPKYFVALTNIGNGIWKSKVNLPKNLNVEYRYFIYVPQKNGNIHIRYWETSVMARNVDLNQRGAIDKFGYTFGELNIKRGWLTSETVLQIKIYNNPFKFINQFDENFHIKLLHIDNGMRHIEHIGKKNGIYTIKNQPKNGIKYETDSIIIFHVTLSESKLTDFKINLVFNTSDQIIEGIMEAHKFDKTYGMLTLNLNRKDADDSSSSFNAIEHVGSVNISYLLIKPSDGVEMNFGTTYAHSWPSKWTKLDIGHRGLGESFIDNGAPIDENTIVSFEEAARSKVDFIEFDIHLTKDLVPIVYHDFSINIYNGNDIPTSPSQLTKVNICDLTYDELTNLPLYHIIGDKIIENLSNKQGLNINYRPFPKLIEVFAKMCPLVGFDMEIKWPQKLIDGSVESVQTIDKNIYVNRIIDVVMNFGCGRDTIMSSFDADICTMLRYKQNKYPVIFMSLGKTDKWKLYDDPRSTNPLFSINNVEAFELVGIGLHMEDIKKNPDLVKKAFDRNQIVFLWGNDVTSQDVANDFKNLNITGLIYDRVDLLIPNEKPNGLFETII